MGNAAFGADGKCLHLDYGLALGIRLVLYNILIDVFRSKAKLHHTQVALC